MRKKLLVIGLVVLVISTFLFFTFKKKSPYTIANDILGFDITHNSKVEVYNYEVNDFDGSSDVEIFFSLRADDIKRIVENDELKKFKSPPPVTNFSFGKEINDYLKTEDSAYYKFNGLDIMDFTLAIVNLKRKKIIIKKVQTYK